MDDAQIAGLLESEERLRFALEATATNVWDWNIQKGTVYFTDQWLQSLGYKREETAGSFAFWQSIVHPEDWPQVDEALQAHFAGRTPVYECENRLRMKSGEYRYNLDRGKVVEWDSDGKPVRMVGTDTDITDRKRLEVESAAMQRRLMLATQVVNAGIWEWDLRTNQFIRDAKIYEILGLSPESTFPYASWTEGIHPDDLAKVQSALQEVLAHAEQGEIEYRIIRSDGAHRNIFSAAFVLRDNQGNATHLIGVVRDITEQKQMQQAMRQLAAIVESSEDAIISRTFDGIITSWNHGAESLFGYSAAEAIGQPIHILIPSGEFDNIPGITDQILSGQVIRPIETKRLTRNGRLVDVSLVLSPIKTADNEIVGVSMIYRDITERRQMEQKMRESAERFRLVVEHASDIILLYDATGKLRYVSPTLERITGFTAEEAMLLQSTAVEQREKRNEIAASSELAAPAVSSLVHPDDRSAGEAALRFCAMHPGESVRVEFRYLTKQGNYVDFEMHAQSFVNSAGEYEIVGIVRDISERKAIESTLRQLNDRLEFLVAKRTAELEATLAELQRADRMKNEFLAAVSHELRTPLTAVISMTDALLQQSSGQLNARQMHYVHTIQHSEERLLATVKDILDYANLIAGKIHIDPEPCRLSDLCAAGVRAVHPLAEEKQQKLEVSIDPPDLTIVTDTQGIVQILQKLLDNAIKFTPEGQSIGVKASCEPDADDVHLVVWDTGIGIDPAKIPWLFRPFTQLDGGLARSFNGIGLGLAFVGQMVALLGGTITVASELGRGSHFHILLPQKPHTVQM